MFLIGVLSIASSDCPLLSSADITHHLFFILSEINGLAVPPIFLFSHRPVNHAQTCLLPDVSIRVMPGRNSILCFVCVYCMWAVGVCQSGYPFRLSKRLMGNLQQEPNHRLSLSFQQKFCFLGPFKREIITEATFSGFSLQALSHCAQRSSHCV